MTILEAMSLAKPCVVTDAGGNKEIILHEHSGLVTKNDDVKEFANAMSSLLLDEALRVEFGSNAKSLFDNKFDVRHMSEQYKRIYAGRA